LNVALAHQAEVFMYGTSSVCNISNTWAMVKKQLCQF